MFGVGAFAAAVAPMLGLVVVARAVASVVSTFAASQIIDVSLCNLVASAASWGWAVLASVRWR